MRTGDFSACMITNGFRSSGNGTGLLNVLRLPARVNATQAAELIGCREHDIPALVRRRLLKPLGEGRANSVKYFATAMLEDNCRNASWLDKVTRAIAEDRNKPHKPSGGDLDRVVQGRVQEQGGE